MLITGKIIKSYGILGWLEIVSFTENKETIFKYSPLYIYINKKYEVIKIEKWKKNKKKILIKIFDITNRTKSQKFVKKNIFIKNSSLPKLGNNEYYWKDIIKCKIFNEENIYLGKINKIIDIKTYDILVIKTNKKQIKKKEILIPFIIKKYIKNVDLYKKKIIIKNYSHFV
ncbi:ribosome maturation factor RimM [Buchnera aphidicola (Ceratovacuna keduensis)]|uniref:ribosome maturation factor RimM n=1 Tax=Buchnera aphidicola TaxID=9 RepID=UPI0031B871EE